MPWGPYGFNSGVTQEDVSRAEARKLGLDVDSVAPKPAKITDGVEASTKKMDPETKRKLREELRRGIAEIDAKPTIERAAREAAGNTRRIMLDRGLTGSLSKGDAARAAKYRKAIAELPIAKGLNVRDDGDKIVLEKTPSPGIVTPLPDDSKRDRNPETETRKLPTTDQDRPLSQAANDARRILHADGTLYGNEDDPDFILRQIASLESGAGKAGFLHQGLIPDLKGGVEHDVTFDDATGTVLKFTKPDKAAYAVNFDLGTPKMASATPLEYLERLEIQNEIFGDNLRFVGVARSDDGRRIVTRQDVVTGRPARWEEIVRMMTDLGFTKLQHNHGVGYEDSYAFVRDDAAVFDMRPAFSSPMMGSSSLWTASR